MPQVKTNEVDEAKRYFREAYTTTKDGKVHFDHKFSVRYFSDVLIKEVEHLADIVTTYDIVEMDSLLRQVDEFKAEHAELKESLSELTKKLCDHEWTENYGRKCAKCSLGRW